CVVAARPFLDERSPTVYPAPSLAGYRTNAIRLVHFRGTGLLRHWLWAYQGHRRTGVEHEYSFHGRPELLPLAAAGRPGAARRAGLRGGAERWQRRARLHGRRGRGPGVRGLRPHGQSPAAAARRRRSTPLRLERLQLRALPLRPSAARAALPPRARAPLVADLRPGHPAGPAPAAPRPRDRGRSGPAPRRLLAPAHRSLRA